MMANNLFEQFEELYSCWGILEKVGRVCCWRGGFSHSC